MPLQSRSSNNDDLGPRRSATIGYMHIVEDSHCWTDLKQMLELLKYKHENVDKQFLKTGLENTLNNGYNLFNTNELKMLINTFPNDTDLGKYIRIYYGNKQSQ